MECLFRKTKCKAVENKELMKLRQQNIIDFIHKVCSMCVKKQYASTKEHMAKRHYSVVNTL